MKRRAVHSSLIAPIVLIALAVAAFMPESAAAADEGKAGGRTLLSGVVTRVYDGDTLELKLGKRHVRVHLSGVDAPEIGQPWGREAAAALSQMVLNQSVDLAPLNRDRHHLMVTVMFVGEEEVGAALIRDGNAWADRENLKTSDSSLCEVEASARNAKRGLWALPAAQRVAPWEYRRRFLRRHFTDYSQESVAHCMASGTRG